MHVLPLSSEGLAKPEKGRNFQSQFFFGNKRIKVPFVATLRAFMATLKL